MVGPAKEIIDRLSVDCKEGGSFYVCQNKAVQFIGCCTLDPCKTENGNCPAENLRNTTFNKLYYSQFKAQSCLSDDAKDTFYACAETNPPFMGCCSDNACQSNGCAAANLSSAVLSKDKENASVFLPAETNTKPQGLSSGATAGIAIGAVVCGLIIIVLGVMWFRRRKKANSNRNPASEWSSWMSPGTASTPFLGNYTNLNAHYNRTASPYQSPSMNSQQQLNNPWQSPPMGSMHQWQGVYDNRGLLGPPLSGYIPGSVSSENGEGWQQQQTQQPAVQELPPQHGIVELPGKSSKNPDGHIQPVKDGDGPAKPDLSQGSTS